MTTALIILLALVCGTGGAFALLRTRRRTDPPAPPEVGTLTLAPSSPEPVPVEAPVVALARVEPETVAAPEPEPEPGPTVLVVDDEDAVRSSTARLLGRAGFEVLQAGSADEALRVVRAYDGTIAAMLSDVVMPGANGFELAGAVREVSPGTAIILFTAYTPAAIQRHNLRGGSDAKLLQKPLERQELLDAITAAIASD